MLSVVLVRNLRIYVAVVTKLGVNCSYQSICNLSIFFLWRTGDSGYTTYLVNPTTIDKALAAAGAIRIGEMGKADANAKKIGEDSQEKVIARWKEDLYVPLATTLSSVTEKDTTTDKDLKEMQSNTIPILMKLDPSYSPPKEFVNATPTGEISKVLLIVGLIAAIIAVLLATGMVDVHLW